LITFVPISQEACPDVQIHVIPASKADVSGGNWHYITKFLKVRRLVKSIKPNIFHSLYATSYGVTGALVGHKNYVITALGSDLLISGRNSRIYRKALQFAFRKAKWITVMSQEMYDVTREMGTDMSKVDIVPFGIDPVVFNSDSRALPDNEFVITSTRNLETIYNIPHLIRAVAIVKDKIPNLKVNIMGFGRLKDELIALTHELGLSELVTFWGEVNRYQISETLNKTHIFVSVSLSDGNNISLNEAMACDAFCIATNIAANREWITDGENGFLVEINDVEGLASRIMETYTNYEAFHKKASPINKKVIEEKGIWANNMKVVEQKYHEMINN
jgi:glycosyltransferase involved in cell wall biosynthesis